MRERRTAATDGATLLTDDCIAPLTANAVIRLTMLDHHTRVWCAHGWQDIKPIAAELLRRLPLQSNPAKDGVWGTFNIRGHFYSFRVRMGGITDIPDLNFNVLEKQLVTEHYPKVVLALKAYIAG